MIVDMLGVGLENYFRALPLMIPLLLLLAVIVGQREQRH